MKPYKIAHKKPTLNLEPPHTFVELKLFPRPGSGKLSDWIGFSTFGFHGEEKPLESCWIGLDVNPWISDEQ